MPDDGYSAYYAAKLWGLIPAIYRSLDSDPVEPGPLRELVNRIAAQAAVVRRSIDRLWEDQSIETCDDWLIPYIGDLLATNLVSCMDARGQRLDVAKTIYYRRRKGTVGLLEELASDIAGRDARVVEFFRRLGRTRHVFDPPIGQVPVRSGPADPPQPAVIEGLAGAYTRTPMGGYADLRQAYGASQAQTPFDEYFHTADFRGGRQSVGWHNIPKLGVFVWWLQSFGVNWTTPVPDSRCPGQFTFDPTGREIRLFAAAQRTSEQFGEHWITPDEWQLPVPITNLLLALQADQLDPGSMAVWEGSTPPYSRMSLDRAPITPERGRFRLQGIAPADNTVHVTYHYGFTSTIGAGPYDQRLPGMPLPDRPGPLVPVTGGGNALNAGTTGLPAQATVSLDDSLTYSAPADLPAIQQVAILGRNEERPVVRWTAAPKPQWVLTGTPGSSLVIQGVYFVGGDIVLRGEFDSVQIRCCTLDPGTSGADLTPPALYRDAVDDLPLSPTHLFVEARVQTLTLARSITGPIRTRTGGGIETLAIQDSIVQQIPESAGGPLAATDLFDAGGLAARLKTASDPLSSFLKSQLSAATQAVSDYVPGTAPPGSLVDQLIQDLNALLGGPSIYTPARFAQVRLSPTTQALVGQTLSGQALFDFNRALLQDAYRVELSPQAIATVSGGVQLARTTILGTLAVHRLDASECILDDIAIAEDEQHGCIRFSAYAEGSVVHAPYESVTVAPRAPLFRTRTFGDGEYARLQDDVDQSILSGRAEASIAAGAQNGSEMGAFALERIPLKKQGLRLKFAEFMPIGLEPVWIDVT